MYRNQNISNALLGSLPSKFLIFIKLTYLLKVKVIFSLHLLTDFVLQFQIRDDSRKDDLDKSR